MKAPSPLFADRPLRDELDQLWRDISQWIGRLSPRALLNATDADVVGQLISSAAFECPTLREPRFDRYDPIEVIQHIQDINGARDVAVTQFTLTVPFDGDYRVFQLTPTSGSADAPQAVLEPSELRVVTDRSADQDATAMRAAFDDQLNRIRELLADAESDIANHRSMVEAELPRLVAERRAKLLADRELQASIGFPISQREDANAHAVPIRRRQVNFEAGVGKPTGEGDGPEPTLLFKDYEATLTVLHHMRSALERSPSTARHLLEEQVRDVLLIGLNAQFEGAAAGEVFNGAGKTDILIRVDDRNVFIGECKFWKGPKTIPDALEQLLGYLVWRDTKAALLLFIRDADVTSVMAKAVAKVEEHPNYKRKGKHANDERHDFVLHASGDLTREIHLALLPFVIGAKE
ncbi:hypothetical protein [Lentzea kentuckyensis]|uniref:hypothetical protein n=1 Tax=Lentzea kentuckyensis TaxID=360086 RepID=UPI00117B90D3|nr:hypothetical protein [Lentzea kentuckyensis]